MSLLGVDIGTSATKGVLLDGQGHVLATAQRGYRVAAPIPERAELSAERVWRAARLVIAELAETARAIGSPVRAVCAGGSGDEVVAVDARGRPTGPVIMAMDRRSEAEGQAIEDACDRDALFERTGLADVAATPLARYRWIERHRPASATRIVRLLSWPEWIATRLGLPAATDPTMAARTLAWDIRIGAYGDGGCPPLETPEGLLSPVVPTGTVLGEVAPRVATLLGLAPGARYVVGGFDQAMATLGAAVIRPGIAHDGNGSWEALSTRVPAGTVDRRLRPGGWSVGPAATGDGLLEAMGSWPGGLVLRWAASLVLGGTAGDRSLGRALEGLPSGRPRLLASVGFGAPGTQPLAGAGMLAGLDLASTHGELLLAVLDGLAHRLRRAIRELDAVGVPVRAIRATGGGAGSERWLQLKADATGVPVERPAVEQAGAFAAAVLAGSGIGALPPAEEAVRELVVIAERYEPDAAAAAWHEERAGLHAHVVGALDGLARA